MTSGGGRTPVRHTIHLGIVIFLVYYVLLYSTFTLLFLISSLFLKIKIYRFLEAPRQLAMFFCWVFDLVIVKGGRNSVTLIIFLTGDNKQAS